MRHERFGKQSEQQAMTISANLQELKKSTDFLIYHQEKKPQPYSISYYKSLIDPEILHRDILPYLNSESVTSLSKLCEQIPITDKKISCDWKEIEEKILRGNVLIQFSEHECLLVEAALFEGRETNAPEVEFSVVGPKEAFVELLDRNMNLIRKRLPTPKLRFKEIIISELSKVRVVICYIDGITNEEYVNTMTQRLMDIEFDFIMDSTMLIQMIEDNSKSLFPQLVETERPDRVASLLAYGQVAVLVDGSPNAILGPAPLAGFFVAYEDYYLPWNMASFFRLIRIFGVIFSIVATSLYIAILTYHSEIIPNNLLKTIISSRVNIPFSPFVEVIIMELSIELLRESSIRLPLRGGQTIGTVGGIVLGTAAVQASLSSNILLILVALSALASFTTPLYRMSNTIRVLRFFLIITAQVWGLLGIFICGMFILCHLLRLKSLGIPYLVPFYPLRTTDFEDSLVRTPYSHFSLRPGFFRTKNPRAFDGKNAKAKKDKVRIDVDE
ncbi:spore germination protein [Neobacillus sp. BF23-41]|uniref:spore germination protein n=1 Tax=Neobacillus sp. BF23-41 TaxID=3240280 RepID=UPI0034E39703